MNPAQIRVNQESGHLGRRNMPKKVKNPTIQARRAKLEKAGVVPILTRAELAAMCAANESKAS